MFDRLRGPANRASVSESSVEEASESAGGAVGTVDHAIQAGDVVADDDQSLVSGRSVSLTEGFAAVLASSVVAGLALIASFELTRASSYPEFIVGSITWTAETKFQDLVASPVLIGAFAVSLILILSLFDKLKSAFGSDVSSALANQLIWWSMPAAATTATLLLSASVNNSLFYISAAGIAFVAGAHLLSPTKAVSIGADTLGLSALAILFLSLIPLELALVLGRAPDSLFGDPDTGNFANATYVAAIVGLAAGLYLATAAPTVLSDALPKMLLVGQIGLSSIFLTLYPATLVLPDGTLSKYSTSSWLRVLVVAFVIAAVADTLRRYVSRARLPGVLERLSPVAIFALLAGLRAGNTVAPIISTDDYHFGETLLGWWSYTHGAVPYVDYIPPHGLIVDDLAQMLSFMFYDSSAASVPEAGRLGLILLSFAAFMAMFLFTRHLAMSFIAVFFSNPRAGWLFMTPFLALWFSRHLMSKPAKWLAVWMLTAPILVLGIPPQGIVLAGASGVMALWAAWRMYRDPDERTWGGIGVSAAVLGVAAILTPFVAMLTGAVNYVLENAAINQVAYGIAWSRSLDAAGNPDIVLEALRVSWVATPVVCILVMYYAMRKRPRNWTLFLPAAVILLFVVLLVPYSMGRIDPASVSRSGRVASFGWTILLPITAWRIIKGGSRTPLIFALVWMSAAMNFVPLSSSNWVDAASAQVPIPPITVSEEPGLSNLGTAHVQGPHRDRLVRLGTLLDSELDPGETYLDLTSRNAQYFYFDRKPLLRLTAAYNLVALSAQKSAVETLSKDLPKLAVLEGENILHDGGGVALRTPYLYRYVVDNYRPQYKHGFIIGRSKALTAGDNEPAVEVEVRPHTDENWENGVHRVDTYVLIDDPALVMVVDQGDQVLFADGETRTIVEVSSEHNALRFDGGLLDPAMVGYPNTLRVLLSTESRSEYDAALFQQAFGVNDLQYVPVSWGRSQSSLAGAMDLVNDLSDIPPVAHDLERAENSFTVTGIDPGIRYDISSLELSGHDAGLLKLDFQCVGQTAEPRLQVFWWGDAQTDPFEAASVNFTAADGALIVPLDSAPMWLTLNHVRGLRIDLSNAGACSAFTVDNVELLQRSFD